jgi:hypothetical protein
MLGVLFQGTGLYQSHIQAWLTAWSLKRNNKQQEIVMKRYKLTNESLNMHLRKRGMGGYI